MTRRKKAMTASRIRSRSANIGHHSPPSRRISRMPPWRRFPDEARDLSTGQVASMKNPRHHISAHPAESFSPSPPRTYITEGQRNTGKIGDRIGGGQFLML